MQIIVEDALCNDRQIKYKSKKATKEMLSDDENMSLSRQSSGSAFHGFSVSSQLGATHATASSSYHPAASHGLNHTTTFANTTATTGGNSHNNTQT
jgi:hypothetical protein